MTKTGKVIWFEVLGHDTNKLRGFYGELFGWKFNAPGDPTKDYRDVGPDQAGIGGGIGGVDKALGANWATFYISVDDPAATLARAHMMGGKVLMPVTELPEVTIAVIADPEGHPIGIAKPRA